MDYEAYDGEVLPLTPDKDIDSLVSAITKVESGGNKEARSSQGARGSMQIMPATFKQYARAGEDYENDTDRRAAAIRKIREDYAYYDGDVSKTAAAYIGGRGAVRKDGTIRDDVKDALGTTPVKYANMVKGRMKQQTEEYTGKVLPLDEYEEYTGEVLPLPNSSSSIIGGSLKNVEKPSTMAKLKSFYTNSTATAPESEEYADPMGTGNTSGATAKEGSRPSYKSVMDDYASAPNPYKDPMLEQKFVDDFKQRLAEAPIEKRLNALKAYAKTDGVYGRAAKVILAEEEYRNKKVTEDGKQEAMALLKLPKTLPPKFGKGKSQDVAFPESEQNWFESIDGVSRESIAKANAMARGLGESRDAEKIAEPTEQEKAALLATQRKKFANANPIAGGLKSGAAGFTQGLLNSPGATADWFNKVVSNPLLNAVGMDSLKRIPTAPGTDSLGAAAQSYSPDVTQIDPSDAWKQDKFGEWLVASMAQNTPSMALSIASAFVPALRVVLLPTMGASSQGKSYADGDDSRVSAVKGASEIATEMLPLGIFDKLKNLTPSASKTVLADVGKRLLATGGAITGQHLTEAIGESINAVVGNALDKYAQGKDVSLTKGVESAAVLGGLTGNMLGASHAVRIASNSTLGTEAERALSRSLQNGVLSDATIDIAQLNPNLAAKPTPADIVSPSVTTVDEAIALAEKSIAKPASTDISKTIAASADQELLAQIQATAPQTAVNTIAELLNDTHQTATQAQAVEAGAPAGIAAAPQPNTDTAARAGAVEAAGLNAIQAQSSATQTESINAINSLQTSVTPTPAASAVPVGDGGVVADRGVLPTASREPTLQPQPALVQGAPETATGLAPTKDVRLTPVSQRVSAPIESAPIPASGIDSRLIPVSQRSTLSALPRESVQVTPPEIRAEQMRQQKIKSARAGKLRTITYNKSPFLAFLGKHGVVLSEKSEFSPDKNPMLSGYGPMFRRNGLPVDQLIQRAVEEGYLPPGTNDDAGLRDLISQQMGGKNIAPMYTEDGATNVMQAEIDKRASFDDYVEAASDNEVLSNLDFIPDDQEVSGYNDLSTASQNKIQALLAQANDLGIDAESILEKIQDETREKSDDIYYAEAIRQLEEVNAAGAAGSRQDAGQQSQAPSAEEGLSRPSFGLEADSPEALQQREDAANAAAEEQAAQNRAAGAAAGGRKRSLNNAEQEARAEKIRKERADAAVADFALGDAPPSSKVSTEEAAGQRGIEDDTPASAMSVQDLLRAAAQKMDDAAKPEQKQPQASESIAEAATKPVTKIENSGVLKDKGVAMYSRASGMRLPDVVIGNKLGTLINHPDYAAAKAGDTAAALRIAIELVDTAMVEAVKKATNGADVIVPVVSIEATGRNKIPQAVAEVLAKKLGTTAESQIVQIDSPKRTVMDGLSRMLNAPVFDGPVQEGAAYVMVDDTVTQGGTFAALASHITKNGGEVAGAVVLTGKQYSAKLELSPELLSQVHEKFQSVEPDFKAATGYGFDALTESEARYLAKHDNAQSIRDRIIEAGSTASLRGNAGDTRKDVSAGGLPVTQVQSAIGNNGNYDPTNPDIRFSVSDSAPKENWYSELNRQIEASKTNAMPANMWSSWINSLKGVKADEIEWSGVQDWLKLQTGKVTKADVSNYLNQNGVQVQETVLGDTGADQQKAQQEARRLFEKNGYELDFDPVDGEALITDPDGEPIAWDELPENLAQALDKASDIETLASKNPVKYAQYQLPGGTNYREVLLTLPEKDSNDIWREQLKQKHNPGIERAAAETRKAEDQFGIFSKERDAAREKERVLRNAYNTELTKTAQEQFKPSVYLSSHWDQKNVLAHIRVNDRTDADGAKILFIEEIQSDFAQDARKKGIVGTPEFVVRDIKTGSFITSRPTKESAQSVAGQYDNTEVLQEPSTSGVPNAPFIGATDKWLSLALKRVIKMAVDGGYDKVAFVNGEQSAERYDLSKQVDHIDYTKGFDGSFRLGVVDKNGQEVSLPKLEFTADELEGVVGKEVAQKIINGEGQPGGGRKTLRNVDLKIGGSGMKSFYDKIVPNTAKEVIRKLGGAGIETVAMRQSTGTGKWVVDDAAGDYVGAFKTKDEAVAYASKNPGYVAHDGSKGLTQPGFTLTDAMKDKAAGGMALFNIANKFPELNIADKTEYTPTNGTEPASDKQQALATELARRINNGAGRKRRVPTVLHAVNAGSGSDATLRRTVAATRTFSKSIFGHSAVFVDFEGETLFRGAMSDAIPDTIFLDIKSDKPHMAVLGHELLHQLRKSAPDIYERLNERLNQVLKPDALNKYSKALIAKYDAKGLQAPTNIDEELIGDIVGDNFVDPEFLQLLGENQPSSFRKVLDSIKTFLDGVLAKLTGKNRPFGTDQYLTDIKAAREAVAIAMREFSGSQVGAMTNERVTDDVLFSGADKPLQTDSAAFKKWFGDSKVVDAQGKPLVMYHGSKESISAFDAKKINKNNGMENGVGFYFSAKKELAQNFGSVGEYYLRLENPFIVSDNKSFTTEVEAKIGFTEEQYAKFQKMRSKKYEREIATNIVRTNGYDGIISDKEMSEVVVFDPTQVKSATGNNGDFNASNPDIRFAVGGKDDVPAETKWQGRQRVVQDKFNRFKVLQDWLTEKGIDLSEGANVYRAETLMSGRVAARKEDFRELQMKPLIQKTQKANISMEDVGDFLKAQHAPEANKRAQQIHNDPDKTAFGVTDADAKATIDAFKKRSDFQQFKDIANEWRDVTNQTKQILLDGGILSKDMVGAWENTYSVYVPVKGMDDAQGTGKGLSVNGKTKRRMGHTLRDEAILENIWRDHEQAISLDEKNNIGKTLIRFALEAKNDDIITVGQPEKRQIMKAGEVGFQASPMLAENEVNVYIDGHAVRVQINDAIAARVYTNLGVEQLNSVLSASREVNTWLSKAYTGYSPDFIFTNPIRDAIQGSMTLTGEYGAIKAAKIFTRYPRAMKELSKHLLKRGSSQLVNDYRAAGGSTGASYLSDLERINNDMQASYNEYAGVMGTYDHAYKKAEAEGSKHPAMIAAAKASFVGIKKVPVVGHFLQLMNSINSLTENALRVATFDTLIEDGMNKEDAAAQAKNLMNFNRKGEIANTAGSLYLFFNPSVQGSQVMFRALVESKHKGQVQALAGMMVLSAMGLAELAMSGGADDEEKWKNTPDHVKDGNLVVGFGDMQYTLTLPYGYRIFHTLGNVISDYMHGGDGHKLGIRLASSVLANLSPVGNPIEGNVQGFSVLPTLPKMLLGPSVNQDSFGREIAPKQWNNAKPDSQIMNRNTRNTAYSATAQGLNNLTGGTDYKKGLVDVSPETLKYWVKSLTGGAGQFAVDTVQSPYKVSQGVDLNVKDMPIIRRFAREIGVSDTRSAFWERAKEAKNAADAFSAAKKANDSLGVQEVLKNNRPLIDMAEYAQDVQKMVKAKRDETDRINADKSLTPKQKQEKTKLIEMQEATVYTRFIKVFDKQTQIKK